MKYYSILQSFRQDMDQGAFQGWGVIPLCGHKYLMAAQELHTLIFVGRERNGCSGN